MICYIICSFAYKLSIIIHNGGTGILPKDTHSTGSQSFKGKSDQLLQQPKTSVVNDVVFVVTSIQKIEVDGSDESKL